MSRLTCVSRRTRCCPDTVRPTTRDGPGRELGHVDTDLGDDDLRGAPSDARDRVEPITGLNERGHQPVDLLIEALRGGSEVVDVGQQFPDHDGVELAETAGHTLSQQLAFSLP